MAQRLHDLFHSLAHHEIDGFNDSPLTPPRLLIGEGQEYREKLAGPRPHQIQWLNDADEEPFAQMVGLRWSLFGEGEAGRLGILKWLEQWRPKVRKVLLWNDQKNQPDVSYGLPVDAVTYGEEFPGGAPRALLAHIVAEWREDLQT